MPGIPRRRGTQYTYLRKRMESLKIWRFLMQPSLEDIGSSKSRFSFYRYSFAVSPLGFVSGNKITPCKAFVKSASPLPGNSGHRRAFMINASCRLSLFERTRFPGAFFTAIKNFPRFRGVTQIAQVIFLSAIAATPDIRGDHFAVLREGDRFRRTEDASAKNANQ